jgi:hypothetical protein
MQNLALFSVQTDKMPAQSTFCYWLNVIADGSATHDDKALPSKL